MKKRVKSSPKTTKTTAAEEDRSIEPGSLSILPSDIVIYHLFMFIDLKILFSLMRLVCKQWNWIITGFPQINRANNNQQLLLELPMIDSCYSLRIPSFRKINEIRNSMMTCIQSGYFRASVRELKIHNWVDFCRVFTSFDLENDSFKSNLGIATNLLDDGFTRVEILTITNADSFTISEGLCKSNVLPNLRSLSIEVAYNETINISEFVTCGFLANLTCLDFGSCSIKDSNIMIISECQYLSNLEKLQLDYNGITQLGTFYLSTSKYLSKLTHLDLTYNNIGDSGLAFLSQSETLNRISTLILDFNGISNLDPLLKSSNLRNLSYLNVERCHIDLKSVLSLTSSQNLSVMERIELYHSNLAYNESLPSSCNPISKTMKHFILSSSNFDDLGVQYFCNAIRFNSIVTLNLRGNQIGNEGLKSLSNCIYFNNLKNLDLSMNRIEDEGARYFAMHTNMPNLEQLNLKSNQLTEEGKQFLHKHISQRCLQLVPKKFIVY